MRAEDEIVLDVPLAALAERQFLQVLEQVLLFEGALEGTIERLLGAEDHVEQDAGDVEEDDEERREDLRDDATAARLDVAEGPDDEDEPERNQVRPGEGDQRLDSACDDLFHPARLPPWSGRWCGELAST